MRRRTLLCVVSLLLSLLAAVASGVAQERVIIRAPAPDGPTPAWLDNEVTRRFVVWQELEARWKALESASRDCAFVPAAAAICFEASELPRVGEPRPGLRASLLKAACGGALRAFSACQGLESTAAIDWSVGFKLGGEQAARWRMLEDVERLLRVAADAAVEATVQAEARAASNAPRALIGRAAAARGALLQSPCERAGEFMSVTGQASAPSIPLLMKASSPRALDAAWGSLPAGRRTFEHVAAYHFAEALLELQGDAERAATEAATGDLTAATEARDAYQCLHAYRPMGSQLARAERQLRALKERADKEAACTLDPVCSDRREAAEQKRLEREMRRYEAEHDEGGGGGCCRVCTTGYACGDSCISRSKSCHKGQGCACDG